MYFLKGCPEINRMILSATISAWANAERAIFGEFVAATSPIANMFG